LLSATYVPTTIKREHTVAFPWQQWLFEHAIMYCGTYFVYLVIHSFTGIQLICHFRYMCIIPENGTAGLVRSFFKTSWILNANL